MIRSWWQVGLALGIGLGIGAVQFSQGSPSSAIAVLLLFAAVAAAMSPLIFPRSIGAAQARERSAEDGRPIIYWRPGCPYCLRLRVRLGLAGRHAHWVNIWSDPAGAAAVRQVTGGDETVPTVVTAEESFVNPDPSWVRARLRVG
jgi:mycoredoxin